VRCAACRSWTARTTWSAWSTLDDLLGRLGRELFNLAEGIRHEVEVR
jgi:hypothetical protein